MATPQASAAVHQYLTAVLSNRGKPTLPYADDVRETIQQHLTALSHAFPTLRPAASPFTHNDGRTTTLLRAEGSVSLASSACLPVSIWLLEAYPRSPPAVFLSFPPRAAVMPRHALVDHSGAVSVPYLRSWLFPYYNLVDLVRSLVRLFSQDPPFVNSPRTSDARTKQTAEIMEAVQRDLETTRKSCAAEMEALLATQTLLLKRKEEIGCGVEALEEEKELLEQQLQMICMNCDLLAIWMTESRNKVRTTRSAASVDQVFEPWNARSRQLTECAAADLAAEDVIDALDEALREGSVPLGAYLKNVRALSRGQFFHRAMAAMIGGDN